MILEALNSGVDGFIFDLEDLVPLADKEAARSLTRKNLAEIDFGSMEVMVRVNNYEIQQTGLDLTVLSGKVRTVLYPKAETVEDIQRLDKEIGEREAELGIEIGSIRIQPAVESAKGLLNAFEIALASKRIHAITLGGGDLTKDLKAIKSGTGVELLYAKSHLITVARAAGVKVLDTVYPRTDEEGLIRETEQTFTLGFDGKGVIRGDQVPVIHQVYERLKQ